LRVLSNTGAPEEHYTDTAHSGDWTRPETQTKWLRLNGYTRFSQLSQNHSMIAATDPLHNRVHPHSTHLIPNFIRKPCAFSN